MTILTVLDYIALLSMLIFWLFYGIYTRHIISKEKNSLFKVASSLRTHWVRSFIQHPSSQRIADTQVVNILHRGISFFITITVFIIAGLMAILTSGDELVSILVTLPFQADNAQYTWNIKIIFIMVMFVAAFFRLTWALRQSQYYAIAILGVPYKKAQPNHQVIKNIAKLMSDSSKNFNNALRSYYFGLSSMLWIVHPFFFMIGNVMVVWVIYRREFYSKTLSMLHDINQTYNMINDE